MRGAYPCPTCGNGFRKIRDLIMHRRAAHGDAPPPKPPRDDDPESLAEIAVEADLKRAMGLSLDPLEESLVP